MSPLEENFSLLETRVNELEQELKHSYQQLHSVLHHLSFGVLLVSFPGTIECANPAVERLFGFSEKTLPKKSFHELFEDSFFGFSMEEALNKSHVSISAIISHEQRELEVQSRVIDTCGVLVQVHDRSQIRDLEHCVQHSERLAALGQMGATLAHEIRNPLGGIVGFASLLKNELDSPDHKELTEKILSGAKVLDQLVTNVLDYARPLSLHFTTCSLLNVLKESAELCLGTVKIETEDENITIRADKERLKLVFINLIRNAFEAGSPDVLIRVKKSGTIEIQDFGCGIEEDSLNKIFTPFYTTKTKGTGLGLPEVQKVINAHGWEIKVLSSTKGKGTTFCIHFNERSKDD